ncbi:NAD(P)/FAD-dependent oxidoreductase [Levilactobacillus suantsaii]|uniref:Ferredoxin--NADP reductase n=1 Tax=Levilactobacillus suantsaii TaxID=2292255 RepID=A0A4Q0VK02_9LACO|nr:NAD(P)/FAD-dependent oxidoreductase [Levilactobacillus suantsaii]QMU08138.1 NAD(P)/FAD-dependent oxidoreductase [Levilactobacillus suantsaii]RXI79050.1 NAD(P)/FAD-dependent oxidoreductase [Levilactobacillus suantsaii]
MTETYDITIIGGGPAGMFAAFYAGMRNAKTQLLESLADLGGQVNALYPEKTILDVAGFPGVKGRDLITAQRQQLAQFPLTIKPGQPVTNLQAAADGDGFDVTTAQGVTHSKTVIVAVGNGAFTPRPLTVANADQFTDKGQLVYSVPDLAAFKDQRVLVAGGGDSAIDQALMLEPVAQSVTLLHRRNQFRGLENMVDRLRQSTVTVKTPYLIRQLASTPSGAIDVTLKTVGAPTEEHLVVDKLLVSYGFTSDYHVIEGWDVTFERSQRLIAVDSTMATSVPGIYAIGDGVTYAGKQPLIATAYGEAPTAVHQLMATYFPDKRGPVHSTSLAH